MSSQPPPPPPPSGTPPPFPPAPPPPPPGYEGSWSAASSGFGGLKLTSKGKRFGAFLLEIVLIVVTLVIGWLVWSIILWQRGQTPAKSILGMRVIKLGTQRPARGGDMVLRELVGKWLLSAIPLYHLVSAIFVLADERSQGLWDKIAGTVVCDDPSNRFGL